MKNITYIMRISYFLVNYISRENPTCIDVNNNYNCCSTVTEFDTCNSYVLITNCCKQ